MQKYVPTMYQKSIYTIDYTKLLSKGINCLLFDLDNTIIPAKSSEVSQKAKDLFISLKQKGFKVFICSNSPKKRVNRYKEYMHVDGLYFALKPFTYRIKKLLKQNHPDTKKTIRNSQDVLNCRQTSVDEIVAAYEILCDFFGIK